VDVVRGKRPSTYLVLIFREFVHPVAAIRRAAGFTGTNDQYLSHSLLAYIIPGKRRLMSCRLALAKKMVLDPLSTYVDVIQLRRIGILDVNHEDLEVDDPVVEERQHTQRLDLLDLSDEGNLLADL
jgi:hypothetical protein